MPRNATKGAPEWRGQVGFMNGKRWIEVRVIGIFANHAHVATARAVQKAKLELRKGTRVEQIVVKLARIVGITHVSNDA